MWKWAGINKIKGGRRDKRMGGAGNRTGMSEVRKSWPAKIVEGMNLGKYFHLRKL